MPDPTPDPALLDATARKLGFESADDMSVFKWDLALDLPGVVGAVLSALAAAGRLRQDAEEIQSEEPIPYATTGPEVKPEKAEPHPAVRVATDALAERLEAMWGDTPDGFGRVMLREYADAVAPAVLRWAGDQIRAEAAQLEERDGAGYSYAYGFADAAEFIDPTAEGTDHA